MRKIDKILVEKYKFMDKLRQLKEARPELWWFMADKWFRMLEFSLILGTFYYFKNKTGYFLLEAVYWISWTMFFLFLLEMAEYVSQKFFSSPKRRILILSISSLVILIFFAIITQTAQWIIVEQFIK